MRARSFWGTVAALALLAAPAVAQEDCAAGWAAMTAAERSGDAPAIKRAVKAANDDKTCSGEARQDIARHGALALARLAETLPAAAQRGMLTAALELSRAPPWQVLARLGRLAYDAKDYAMAQNMFEAALNDIEDVSVTPDPPSAEAITKIHALAGQARLLAPRPRPSPPGRSGGAGGLALDNVRGVGVQRAPLPVSFVYDKAEFTAEGAEEAAFLYDFLMEQGAPPITLVGHTDPKGPPGREDAYNCKLSWERVRAVEKYLKDKRYAGSIAVVGMGLRQPLKIIDADRHTPEEVHRMLRRVQFYKTGEKMETSHACPRQ